MPPILCLKPDCAKVNPDGTKFCAGCGTPIRLQDRYVALQVIGQGGFGKTFLAADLAKPSRPQCVVKQFYPEGQGNLGKAAKLFEQEATRLDDLGHHPQIPALLAYCEQDQRQYIVQEFIDGQNLAEILAETDPFSEIQIWQLLADLLPVLQFIHQGNVIHRDIKPANIIRRRSDEKLVLVDFGAAKHATQTALAKTGTRIGSAEYAAPEQALGHAIFASDLYGLGVTCLHLLTQTDPFTLYNPLESKFVWRSHLNGNSVSDALGQILDKLTEQRARDRYQSVETVLHDLQPSVSPPTSSRPPVSPPPPKPPITPTQFQQPSLRNYTETLTLQKTGFFGRKNLQTVPLEMIAMPAGSFIMGSNENDREQPPHLVQVPAFYLGKYAITQAQYQAMMRQNPSHFKGDEHPVESISWDKAQEFCRTLSRQTRRKYRLPTEAEWEHACRAGTISRYSFGDSEDQLSNYAWYTSNSGNKTHPVGEKKPNAWGLYDMHGNVCEWCEDDWRDSYTNKPQNLKDNGSISYSSSDKYKILRGGSWLSPAEFCRSANRLRVQRDNCRGSAI